MPLKSRYPKVSRKLQNLYCFSDEGQTCQGLKLQHQKFKGLRLATSKVTGLKLQFNP